MKKFIITMKHVKKTLGIRDIIKTSIELGFNTDLAAKKCAVEIFEKIYNYKRKERKEAMKILLSDFHDDRKRLFDYADEVIDELKPMLKKFDTANEDTLDFMVKQHGKAVKEVKEHNHATRKKKDPHPFGTGFTRLKNEIRHRPSLFVATLKTKMSMR
jgi:putative ubiquitin-RnfH superfamily antitoxin RatB of RatAB toxin-antitoxin module